MDHNDKKFFEDLAQGHFMELSPAEEPTEPIQATLAKATTIKKRATKEIPASEKMDDEGNFYEGKLTVDVYQNDDEIVIQSTIAGVSPDDVEINVTPEAVTIRGERSRSEEVNEKDFYYQECFWGKFSRKIILPVEVDAEHALASFKNGVLTIRLKKLEKQKSKKVKVKFD